MTENKHSVGRLRKHPVQPEREVWAAGGIEANRLRSIVERHMRLEGEVKALRSDQKDIMAEAKSAGYCPQAIRQLIRIMNSDPARVEEEETLLDIYRRALGF